MQKRTRYRKKTIGSLHQPLTPKNKLAYNNHKQQSHI